MNYYPRNVGDFIKDTVGLSLMERGAYTALLDRYYASEQPIQHAERYRITGAASKADRAAVDYVIGRYFIEQPDGWHQKRADLEIEKYRAKSASASESASVRWSKRNANAMRTHSEGNANQEPVTKKQETEVKQEPARKRATRSHKVPLPDGFGISTRVQEWADKGGHQRLAERLEHFKSKARASGYQYVDWDEAFMGAIRDDWAKLRAVPGGSVARLTPVGQASAQSLDRWIDGEGARDGTNGP
jgi:uncharacterized protein YdaU (DUF1376 family)